MRVALTGASGFIGSFIARHLHAAGHNVTALVRPTSRRDHLAQAADRFVEADQADARAWPALLEGADCMIHNSVDWSPLREQPDLARHLQSNLVSSIELLHASAPRQFIFISSVAVHHDIRPSWNGVIDEDHPLRPNSLYGAYKAAVEAHLWASHYQNGRNTSAFRPCAVYGIDPKIERSHGYALIQKLSRGEKIDKPGGGKFVHVEDVAAAVVAAVGNPQAAGCAFNLADCYARWADWALMAAELIGRKVEVDASSPLQSKNMFSKEAAHSLGVSLDRGHDGIRTHLQQLMKLAPIK